MSHWLGDTMATLAALAAYGSDSDSGDEEEASSTRSSFSLTAPQQRVDEPAAEKPRRTFQLPLAAQQQRTAKSDDGGSSDDEDAKRFAASSRGGGLLGMLASVSCPAVSLRLFCSCSLLVLLACPDTLASTAPGAQKCHNSIVEGYSAARECLGV